MVAYVRIGPAAKLYRGKRKQLIRVETSATGVIAVVQTKRAQGRGHIERSFAANEVHPLNKKAGQMLTLGTVRHRVEGMFVQGLLGKTLARVAGATS